MIPQFLVPGLWFYKDDRNEPFYIGHVQHQTAMLVRKVALNGTPMTDSDHCMFMNLQGIPLDWDIMVNSFGFLPVQGEVDPVQNAGYVYKKIQNKVEVLRGDNMELIKPDTNLFVDIDESGKRFTTYLECKPSKIYLPEISFVHELQILLFSLTYTFIPITINKHKNK